MAHLEVKPATRSRPARSAGASLVVSSLLSLAGASAHALPPPTAEVSARSASSGAAVPAASREPSPSRETPHAREGSVEPAVESAVDVRDAIGRALEFTVTIEGEGVYGAGVLIAPLLGLVLTAQHVVEENKTARVSFLDGTVVTATVIEVDRALDLALLSVPPQHRPAPRLGDATALRPGEELYALGCPRRLGFTVSRGIVSYSGRAMDGARYIQTDLPINEGNSGGPVVNTRGELVGTMSFILRRAQGLSFALPINYAAERFPTLGRLVADAVYLDRFRRWRTVERTADHASLH